MQASAVNCALRKIWGGFVEGNRGPENPHPVGEKTWITVGEDLCLSWEIKESWGVETGSMQKA